MPIYASSYENQTVKRILRYLNGINDHGLRFSYQSYSIVHAYTDVAFKSLSAFFDTDWAGFPNNLWSIGGVAIYIGFNLVS